MSKGVRVYSVVSPRVVGAVQPRTTLIVVAYNSAAVLPQMLASVPPGVPVIVVDNASSDGSAEIAEVAGAQVIRLAKNAGFGPGCNRGAAAASTESCCS